MIESRFVETLGPVETKYIIRKNENRLEAIFEERDGDRLARRLIYILPIKGNFGMIIEGSKFKVVGFVPEDVSGLVTDIVNEIRVTHPVELFNDVSELFSKFGDSYNTLEVDVDEANAD